MIALLAALQLSSPGSGGAAHAGGLSGPQTGQLPVGQSQGGQSPVPTTNQSVYGFVVPDLNGNNVSLSMYQGKALIIVNTGSYSIYANQMRDLTNFYQGDSNRVAVLGFPSNDFNHESAASNSQVFQRYRSLGANFPLFGLSHVTGPYASPLYQFLVAHSPRPGTPIEGDFVKFVTDHQGRIIARLRPTDSPLSLNFQLAVQSVR